MSRKYFDGMKNQIFFISVCNKKNMYHSQYIITIFKKLLEKIPVSMKKDQKECLMSPWNIWIDTGSNWLIFFIN